RQLLLLVRAQPQLLRRDSVADVPGKALLAPVLLPTRAVRRRYEELQFHHLELAGAEHEVARGDLVSEGPAELRDPKRWLAPGGRRDVQEVHEHALCRLGP